MGLVSMEVFLLDWNLHDLNFTCENPAISRWTVPEPC